jgi:hypothetical protein
MAHEWEPIVERLVETISRMGAPGMINVEAYQSSNNLGGVEFA